MKVIPFVVTLCRVAYRSRGSVSPAVLLMAAGEQSCHLCGVEHLKKPALRREKQRKTETIHRGSPEIPPMPSLAFLFLVGSRVSML